MADPTPIPEQPQLSEASVAFLLEHRGYAGCTMSSLTIRERLVAIEAQARPEQDEAVRVSLPETIEAMPTHDNGCRCWPHVSRSDAERMIERVALAEYRSKAATPPPAAPAALDVERAYFDGYMAGAGDFTRTPPPESEVKRYAANYARLSTQEASRGTEPMDIDQLQQDGAQE